ncbi:conserved hypothetical protein [Neospora caninum Liverpool]|uniref:Uncharacterized protein n=1 Tax=Neospora caninum (strain Liverpool) TaxID=572307 RepID=F0VQN2_NEOCL|nr:conserved hypothetical protein [Neospora caninum Liverpool]CBZ56029.1 conserved hypothetical protein [Neospora caninum Liverpool]CEL70776.1 TPA: hypothetical protein BN1204_064550 [Neospora caninum Liverpool]|eukprot:XP_003886055.1 conserved hypothetical protein [Neospora caninum Liverpool]
MEQSAPLSSSASSSSGVSSGGEKVDATGKARANETGGPSLASEAENREKEETGEKEAHASGSGGCGAHPGPKESQGQKGATRRGAGECCQQANEASPDLSVRSRETKEERREERETERELQKEDLHHVAAQLGVDLQTSSGGLLQVLDRESLATMTDESVVQRVLDLQTLLTDLTYQVEAARMSNLSLQRENETLRTTLAALRARAEQARVERPYAQNKVSPDSSSSSSSSSASSTAPTGAHLREVTRSDETHRPTQPSNSGALAAAKAFAFAEQNPLI